MSYDKQQEKRDKREKEQKRDQAREDKRGIVEMFLAEVKEEWEALFQEPELIGEESK